MHLIIEIRYIIILVGSNYFYSERGKKQLFWLIALGLSVGKNQMCCLCGGLLSLQRTVLAMTRSSRAERFY